MTNEELYLAVALNGWKETSKGPTKCFPVSATKKS
jgi:hypothetical protein